ncbi:MAG: hypothetical protein ACYC7E_19690 [Armatimonadota bacterium]
MKQGLFALFAVICLGAALPAFAVGEVTFTFRPPDDGITIIQSTRQTKTETISNGEESGTTVTVTADKTRYEIVKTARGYRRTETLIASSETVDGEEEQDDFKAAFLDMPVEIDLDAAGTITAIRGIEAIRRKLLAGMQGKGREIFERIMTPEKMEMLIKADWASMRDPLNGLTKKPGDTWTVTTNEMIFSSNLLPMKSALTFQQSTKVLGRSCALVKSVAKPNLKALVGDLRKLFTEIEAFPKDANAKLNVLAYSAESSVSVDTALFMALKGTSTEVKKYSVTIDGRKLTFTEEEKTTATSEYESVWRAQPA